jgi:uncharacterized membrane protein
MANKTAKEELLAEMLDLIRKNPGIRPRELHRIMGLKHSATLRAALIKRGLVRKKRNGVATHYYSVPQSK